MQHSPSSETLHLIKQLSVFCRTRMFTSELTRELGPSFKPHKNIQHTTILFLFSTIFALTPTSFLQVSLPNPCAHHSSLSRVSHVPPILSYFIWSSYRHFIWRVYFSQHPSLKKKPKFIFHINEQAKLQQRTSYSLKTHRRATKFIRTRHRAARVNTYMKGAKPN
jgi:hypothetical protein